MANEKTYGTKLIIVTVSGFGAGYSPVASGTVGTIVAIPLGWVFSRFSYWVWFISLLSLFFVACWLSERAEEIFEEHDSSKIVIDEIVGYCITMFAVPFNLNTIIWGFFFFRLFDILKPYPVRRIDLHLKDGYGVVLDDAISGIYANFVLRLFIALHILPVIHIFR